MGNSEKVQELMDRIAELEEEVEDLQGELLDCQQKLDAGTNARWRKDGRNVADERRKVRTLLRKNPALTDAEIAKEVSAQDVLWPPAYALNSAECLEISRMFDNLIASPKVIWQE